MDKKLQLLLRVVVSGGLVYYIISKITLTDLFAVLADANLLLIPVIIVLFFASFLVKAMNYRLLTSPLAHISVKGLLKVSVLSWATGMLAPGKTGELSAIYFLKKEGISLGAGTAISVLDKLITISVLAVVAAITLLRFIERQQALQLIIILFVLLLIVVIAIANEKTRYLVRKFILRKYERKFVGFSKYLFDYIRNNKTLLLFNYGLAVLWLYVSAAMIWIGLLSVGINASMVDVFLITSTALIVAIIPITLGGLGARETVLVLFFENAGIEAVQALAGISIVTVVSFSILAIVSAVTAVKVKKI